MIVAELPLDEELRLRNLESYEILDTPNENDFDELVELASQICKCPISLITLLDKDRQWFKARKGLSDTETSRDVAFCAHAILQPGIITIEDATKDERFADNPLVTGDLNIRFYAGAPIVSVEGYNLGTICIIDHKPRELSVEEERALKLLSNQVAKLLDLRKKNKLIRICAEEMISLKTSSINDFLQRQEADKKAIVTDLHEELAQELASGMMLLKMATENETDRMELLQTATTQINSVISGIRNLSYSITPHAVDWISTGELIDEFIHKTQHSYPFAVDVILAGKKYSGDPEFSLVAIRIIESWLSVLSNEKNISQLTITVTTGNSLELLIEDDQQTAHLEKRRTAVFSSLIYERVSNRKGMADISLIKEGSNLLKIVFPIVDSGK